MKVLHLLNTGKFSGAENVVCQIIGMLNKDVEFVYCSLDGEIRKVVEDKNICFAPIKKMSIGELKKVFREYSPDVIHAHDMRASFYAALACGSIPLVCHVHNNAFDSRRISLKSIFFFYAAMKAKHIFWVSDTAFSGYRFNSVFKEKSSILLNVIDVDALYKKMEEDGSTYSYDIVYVGRFTYQKNPERFINVCKMLIEREPSVKVAMVGDGELKETVLQQIHINNLEKNVFVLGFKRNPLKIIRDSKVLLLTSRWEGLPMCVLESLALGVPVVSTPSDGMNVVVSNEVNGYIDDNDNRLVEFLQKVINSSQYHSMLSKNAIELSGRHNDVDAYRNKIIAVYHHSLA